MLLLLILAVLSLSHFWLGLTVKGIIAKIVGPALFYLVMRGLPVD